VPPNVDDQVREMERYGASRKDIDAVHRAFLEQLDKDWQQAVYRNGAWRTPAGELLSIEVLPENRGAWAVFQACTSQWESPGAMGGRYALPFNAVESAMRMMGVPRTARAELFAAVRVLIEHARSKFIERQPKK
jgi:hypothetical protein